MGGSPRPRPAIHDPWGGPRRPRLPSGGLPDRRLLLGGFLVVVLAFVLGRCTAGGDDGATATDRTVTTAAATTTTQEPIFHEVQRNETLASIASRYGVTVNELAIANNIGDTNHIFVGQRLRIPPPTAATTTTGGD